jgi:hypothetical protein
MTPDPNWFYSSLAQSAAAIIGVIAAVVIARLQQQMAALRTLRRDLDGATEALTLELIRVGDLVAAYVDWATAARERSEVGWTRRVASPFRVSAL